MQNAGVENAEEAVYDFMIFFWFRVVHQGG